MRIATATPFVLKLAKPDAAGEFSGIAATWAVDRDGEAFRRGAFAESLASWRKRGSLPPLLWQHDPAEPIGVLIDAQETAAGLEVVGRIALGTDSGRRAHALLQAGPGALALSPGFVVLDMDHGARVPTFTRIDWAELSLVSVPAQAGAIVTAVKSMAERFSSRKDFEHAARDALHLSANEAKRLAAGGWAALTRDESEAAEHAPLSATVKAALSRIANAR
ncbi:MAG: HK97 family phage prohead protease [Xanthomonadales bacterium]|nr:HK97 family phage prohead protease [Xanthomonadales bacterium]